MADCLNLVFHDINSVADHLEELLQQMTPDADEFNAAAPKPSEMAEELRSLIFDAKLALVDVRRNMSVCTQMNDLYDQKNAQPEVNVLHLCAAAAAGGDGTDTDE